MTKKIFLSLFTVFFLAACAGQGDKQSLEEAMQVGDLSEESAVTEEGLEDGRAMPRGEVYEDVELAGPQPGSQEDLAVNVGDRVYFGYDRHDLTAEAQSQLQLQAQWLREYPYTTVTIEGHTDERGTREYNLALGERRAISVKNYLVALGIDPSRIATVSYGKERPVALGSNPEAWAQNRRAVTVID